MSLNSWGLSRCHLGPDFLLAPPASPSASQGDSSVFPLAAIQPLAAFSNTHNTPRHGHTETRTHTDLETEAHKNKDMPKPGQAPRSAQTQTDTNIPSRTHTDTGTDRQTDTRAHSRTRAQMQRHTSPERAVEPGQGPGFWKGLPIQTTYKRSSGIFGVPLHIVPSVLAFTFPPKYSSPLVFPLWTVRYFSTLELQTALDVACRGLSSQECALLRNSPPLWALPLTAGFARGEEQHRD